MIEPRHRRRLILAPTGTESAEALLATWLVVRGLSTLAWDGLASTPVMYRYALHLAPEWVWGAVPTIVGAIWLVAIFGHQRMRLVACLLAVWWFVVWAALLAAGRPDVSVLAHAGPLLVMAVFTAWAWLLHGWSKRRVV